MASRWVMLGWILLVGVTLRGAPAPGEELTLVRVKYTVDTNDPRHREDWNAKAFAHVLQNVSSLLNQTISIHTAPEPKVLTLGDDDLSNPHQERAPLQGIEINGRVAVIFSPKALTCGWTQSGTCIPSCERIAPEDARKLAANIVVFALTH